MSNLFDFWPALIQTCTGTNVVSNTIDIPLSQAIPRTKRITLWSTLFLYLSLLVAFPTFRTHITGWTASKQPTYHAQLVALTLILCYGLAAVVAYAFLRLYTLVSHVMITNIYKTRGQRLRLLNIQTSILTLSLPASIGLCLIRWSALLGWLIVGVVTIYSIYLMSRAFSVIFHKAKPIHGFGLFAAGTLTTWFVLFIGALGIGVALAILSLCAVLILRIFQH